MLTEAAIRRAGGVSPLFLLPKLYTGHSKEGLENKLRSVLSCGSRSTTTNNSHGGAYREMKSLKKKPVTPTRTTSSSESPLKKSTKRNSHPPPAAAMDCFASYHDMMICPSVKRLREKLWQRFCAQTLEVTMSGFVSPFSPPPSKSLSSLWGKHCIIPHHITFGHNYFPMRNCPQPDGRCVA